MMAEENFDDLGEDLGFGTLIPMAPPVAPGKRAERAVIDVSSSGEPPAGAVNGTVAVSKSKLPSKGGNADAMSEFDSLGDDLGYGPPGPAPTVVQKPNAPGKGGLLRNAAAGAAEGAGGFVNFLADPVGTVMQAPVIAGLAAYHALSPYLGWHDLSPEDEAFFKGTQVDQPGTRLVNNLADAAGVEKPSDIPADNAAERVIRAGAAGLVGGLPFGGAGAAMGAAGGVLGSLAADAVPEPYQDVANLAGNIAAAHTINVAGNALTNARTAVRGGNSIERSAVAKVQNAATMEPAELRAATAEAAGTPSLVPGSNPTLPQAIVDPGLGQLQQTLKSMNDAKFKNLRNDQNSAQLAYLDQTAPKEAGARDVSIALSRHLDDIDAAHQAVIDAATKSVEGQLGGVPQGTTAEEAGSVGRAAIEDHINPQIERARAAEEAAKKVVDDHLDALQDSASTTEAATSAEMRGQAARTIIQGAKAAAKRANDRLWDIVRDHGGVKFDGAPVRRAAEKVLGEVDPQAGNNLGGEVDRLSNLYATWRGPVSLDTLRAARSEVSSQLAKAQRAADEQSSRRLGTIKTAMDEMLDNGILDAQKADEAAVASGDKAPGQTILEKLDDEANRPFSEESPNPSGAVGGSGAVGAGLEQPSGAGGASGPNGAAAAGGGGSGVGGGNRPVAAAAAAKRARPESLASFLVRNGGIRDEAGEFAKLNPNRSRPGLVRETGMSHDDALIAAIQEGFFRDKSGAGPIRLNVSHIRNAVVDELNGRPVYKPEEQGQVRTREQEVSDHQQRIAMSRILQAYDDLGFDARDPREIDHAMMVHAMGADAEDAVRNAVEGRGWRDQEDELSRRAYEHHYGTAPDAEQGELPGARSPDKPLGPTTPAPEVKEAYEAARASHREYATNYREGVIGGILRRSDFGGDYKMRDSAVMASLFKPGEAGVDAVRQLIRGAGQEDAEAIIRGHAAASLKSAAMKNGEFNAAAYRQWFKKYEPALSPFPDLKQRLSRPGQAVAEVDRLTAERRKLEDSNPLKREKSDVSIATSAFKPGEDGGERMRKFAASVNDNPVALRTMQEYAASKYQNEVAPRGAVDSAAHERFMKKFGPALSEMPELKAKLENVGSAQRMVDDAIGAKKTELDAFNKSALGVWLKGDPNQVVNGLYVPKTGAMAARHIMETIENDPHAVAGLRRAVLDEFMNRALTSTPAAEGQRLLSPNQVSGILENSRDMLSEVLTPAQMRRINAVADNLEQVNRTVAATRADNGPGSTRDYYHLRQMTPKPTYLQQFLDIALNQHVARAAGALQGGIAGFLGAGAAAETIKSMLDNRRAGQLSKVNDMIANIIIDPQFAAKMFEKVQSKPKRGWQENLLRSFGQANYMYSINGLGDHRQRMATP